MSLVDSYCEGCEHCAQMRTINAVCNYLLDTGHRRPCPSGKGCTEHTSKKPITIKRGGFKGVMWNTSLAKRMVEEGKTDKEIASAVGRSEKTIQNWRFRNEMRKRRSVSVLGWDEQEARRLFRQGKTDKEISAVVGASPDAIGAWRRRNGLYKPEGDGWDKALAKQMFDDGKSDADIGTAVGRSVKTIARWRAAEGLRRYTGKDGK